MSDVSHPLDSTPRGHHPSRVTHPPLGSRDDMQPMLSVGEALELGSLSGVGGRRYAHVSRPRLERLGNQQGPGDREPTGDGRIMAEA